MSEWVKGCILQAPVFVIIRFPINRSQACKNSLMKNLSVHHNYSGDVSGISRMVCRFVCVCGSVYLPVWTSIAVCYVQLQPGRKERIFSSLFVCLSEAGCYYSRAAVSGDWVIDRSTLPRATGRRARAWRSCHFWVYVKLSCGRTASRRYVNRTGSTESTWSLHQYAACRVRALSLSETL